MSIKSFVKVAAWTAITGLSASAASAVVSIPTVPVGDPGNAADSTGFGSVAYPYNIGTYEVTAGQYAAFLNAVASTDTNALYHFGMASITNGCGITQSGSSGNYSYSVDAAFLNRPVNHVSLWDAMRFANWLHNGQPAGAQDNSTTERGAYTLTPFGTANNTITRNAGWQWAVTSENEWYKAAYYKAGGINSGYWFYPTSSDTHPGRDLTDTMGNNANYYNTPTGPFPIQSPYYSTIVGEFQNSPSPYGTFDQGGNMTEWNETLNGNQRGVRGGSWSGSSTDLRRVVRGHGDPAAANQIIGFRVSQVPGPSSVALLAIGTVMAARRRR